MTQQFPTAEEIRERMARHYDVEAARQAIISKMDLSALTPDQLLGLAAPLVQKINCRIPLTQDEAEQHAAILDEAFKKLAAQRSRDVAERDELMVRRNYRRPACEISQDEAASLNTFYSGVEA